ncbi:hypothetical protein E5288_WYG013357 [Bos mutus]|uniref:Receptor-binding cancer antigen expressed on SiSo cells n=1 Tax=Bos mutus TaxID=72004 RepID=A0A6B0S5G2_9CETA|nr:hypothetical protein [Bos mutus]
MKKRLFLISECSEERQTCVRARGGQRKIQEQQFETKKLKSKSQDIYPPKVLLSIMAITQFRLFKVCTCLATVFSFLKRLICRSGRGRKLSGDQITLPTTVDYSSVPKQTDVEEWTSWDEDAPTSVKIEGGNGNVATQQNALEQLEPDYFKDMTPTIRKTQKIIIKKREPLNFGIPDGSTGFSSRLAATQDMPFIHQSPELGDLDTWQENTNAWEEEEDAAWQAEEVLSVHLSRPLDCSVTRAPKLWKATLRRFFLWGQMILSTKPANALDFRNAGCVPSFIYSEGLICKRLCSE